MTDSRTPAVVNRGNVLVVEDDNDCGGVIVTTLTDAGYAARLTGNRNEAVTAIRRYLYDYIILDFRMPGMTIDEFLTVVSASATKNARVILITAETDAAFEARRYNLDHWLGKPFSPQQLLQLLASIRVFGKSINRGMPPDSARSAPGSAGLAT